MYLNFVDQTTRDDIAAAAAVHRDFGPEYTDAVSETLVDRIGAEIDKRVDARMALHGPGRRGPGEPGNFAPSPAPQPGWVTVAIGAGSMAAGVAATAVALFATATNIHGRLENSITGQQVALVALIWVVIAIVNVAYAVRRRH
jgi:hypothetical protein